MVYFAGKLMQISGFVSWLWFLTVNDNVKLARMQSCQDAIIQTAKTKRNIAQTDAKIFSFKNFINFLNKEIFVELL